MRSAAIVAAADGVSSYSPSTPGLRFAAKTSTDEAERMLSLTRTNMKELYDACPEAEWRWSDSDKLKSFFNVKSRFFFLENYSAFICFRFLVDAKRPVAYIYELQVDPLHLGKGIGRQLVEELERLCRELAPAISHCVLTCFKTNVGAINFYKKLGFDIDKATSPTSPTCSYIILSRSIR